MRAPAPPAPRSLLVAIGVIVLSGCGAAPDPGLAVPAGPTDGRLVARATVLDDGSGPELCLGALMESYPPQCGGFPLERWTWPEQGTERANGVTWGSFNVVGTFDGTRFTAEEVVDDETAARSFSPEPEPDFTSSCPEPRGGWRAPDPGRSTMEDQAKVFARAHSMRGYAGAWVDDRGDRNQDPLTTVVNIQVTEDVAEAETQLREVWGGPLCVSLAEHTEKELTRIADELIGRPGALHAGPSRDAVDFGVSYDDGTLQRELDERYGAGLVRVSSALQPYRG